MNPPPRPLTHPRSVPFSSGGPPLCSRSLLLWARVIGIVVAAGLPPARAVDSDANQITGAVKWTNTALDSTPAVLNFLTSNGFNSLAINAAGVQNGSTASLTLYPPPNSTATSYNIPVQTNSSSPVNYEVVPYVTLTNGGIYWFEPATAPGISPEPSPDVTLDFCECAGLIKVQLCYANGNPAPATRLDMRAFRHNGTGVPQLRALGTNANSDALTVIAREGTYNLKISVYYNNHGDPYVNLFELGYSFDQQSVVVPCGQEKLVKIVVPDPPPVSGDGQLGQITGIVDMRGQNEHWAGSRTLLNAFSGPHGNYRYANRGPDPSCGATYPFVGAFPCNAEGEYNLVNMLPSSFDQQNRPYHVQAFLCFGVDKTFRAQGVYGDYETFNSPVLGMGGNAVHAVSLPSLANNGNQPWDLGDTFVFEPGFVKGDILFCGPREKGPSLSSLRKLYRVPDNDGFPSDSHPNAPNGLPEILNLANSSKMGASGLDQFAPSGNPPPRFTAAGGLAYSLFSGGFVATGTSKDHWVGDYSFALGGLDQEPSMWNVEGMELVFSDTGTPLNRDGYFDQQMDVGKTQSPSTTAAEIIPGQTITNNYHFGFSEVKINFVSTPNSNDFLFEPRVEGTGNFNGIDFEGNPAHYHVHVTRGWGTPLQTDPRTSNAQVMLCLPAGTYTFKPSTMVQNGAGGSISRNTLPDFSYDVSPCQKICICPDLQLGLPNLPMCVTSQAGRTLTIHGWTQSVASVTSIAYELRNNSGTIIASGPVPFVAGVSPWFQFPVTLADCDNCLKIIVRDANGCEACVEATIIYDVLAPVITGCQNITTTATPGTTGSVVNYSVTAMDNCDGPVPVTCVPPSGSVFPCGISTVTCTAKDSCGNISTCTFEVNVRCVCLDVTNEHLTCSPATPATPTTLTYSFDVHNYTGSPVRYLLLSSQDPCFEFVPALTALDLGSPLPHGQSRPVTTTIRLNGPCPNGLCFHLAAHDAAFVSCCAITHCIDLQPPVITGCGDTTIPCQDDRGAFVNFHPAASSPIFTDPIPVACSPPPGWFPVGITTVTCTATDCLGQSSTCSFTVTVTAHGAARWEWARRAGGPAGASGNAVAVDRWGNAFVTGAFSETLTLPNGSGIPPLTSAGGDDSFIAKYNAAGALQWALRAGGQGSDAGRGIAVDAAGDVYVTGDYSGAAAVPFGGGCILPPPGNSDIFVAKYSAGGTCQWAVRSGDTGTDRGRGIAVTGAGVFVTGEIVLAGVQQALVWKLSTAGTSGPQVTGGPAFGSTTERSVGRSIAVDDSGNVYVTGFYTGAMAFPPGTATSTLPVPPGSFQLFAGRFDGSAAGSLHCQWLTNAARPGTPAATGYSEGTGIALDPTGAYCYLSGYYTGTANFGFSGTMSSNIAVANPKHSPAGQLNDFLVAKLHTANAEPLWVRRGSGLASGGLDSNDEATSIAVGPDGNPCITGFLHPFPVNSGTPFVNEGPTVLVASYSPTGQLRWTNHAQDVPAGTPENAGRGIAVDLAGCIHVTGDFTETLNFPPAGQLTRPPSPLLLRDMFVARMCPTCCEEGPNLVQNGSFEITTPVVAANSFNNTIPNGGMNPWVTSVPSGSNSFEIWANTVPGTWPASDGRNQLEIGAQNADQTVSQTITGLRTDCPATFCFDYTGRNGLSGGTPNNDFTVTLTPAETPANPAGGSPIVLNFNPSAYTAASGWLTSCVTFTPASTTYTIAFHGKPHTIIQSGAHIDNVRLTQNCCQGADTDGDGMPDIDELHHGLNPNNPADALLDRDGDGFTNGQEIHDGTDPNDPHSHLILQPGPSGPAGWPIQFEAVAGHSYTVEHSPSLANDSWSPLVTVPAQPADHTVNLLLPPPGSPRSFYRVRTP